MHKTFTAQRARALALVALILMAGSVILSGCVTANKVRAIVDESNTLLMSEQLLAPDPSPDGVAADWQVTAQKIDAFIAAHPDQKTTNGALRIRQAFLYLNNEKYNMSKAAFQDAKNVSTKLNSRDKTLVEYSNDVIWWFEHSKARSLNWDDAKAHLDALKSVLSDDKRDILDVHEYLLEMRTYLALKMTRESSGKDKKAVFRSGIEEYARIFTKDDMTALTNIYTGVAGKQKMKVSAEDLNFCSDKGCDPKKNSWVNIRRRARAVTVLETAAEVVKNAWPNDSGDGYNPGSFNPDFSSASAEAKKLWGIILNRAKQMANIQ